VFIGGKMLATIFHVHVDTLVSLLVVAGVLLGSVALSLLRPPPHTEDNPNAIGAGELPGEGVDVSADELKRRAQGG
jgi:hypothetical protein